MPIIIPELRERFIAAARERLLRDHDATMRQVAQDCNTALGTVYNYFPSKEALLSAAMMGDWEECCRRMSADAAQQTTPLEAFREIVAALRQFTRRYEPVWHNYGSARNNMSEINMRHRQIIDLLSGIILETLIRFEMESDPHMPEILSELVLLVSRTDDGFARIEFALKKILS